jgi:methyltransferase (TIGR00027 family)
MIRGIPSITAEAVALFRAHEARRPRAQRVLDDPIAEKLLSPLARMWLRVPFAVADAALDGVDAGLCTAMVVRHRFLDDALVAALAIDHEAIDHEAIDHEAIDHEAIDHEAIEQVVILGAGLDSRALRLAPALRGRRVFEVDVPSTQTRKRRALAAAGLDAGSAVRVGCDFAAESFAEALARTPGFVVGARTFIVWEGVSMYLPREAVRRTLDDMGRVCGDGSLLGMDFWFVVDGRDGRSRGRRLLPHVVAALGEPFLFSLPPEDAPGFLAKSRLVVVDAADGAQLATRYVKNRRAPAASFHVVLARLGGAGAERT